MAHPLDLDDTRSRLDKIESTLEHQRESLGELTAFLRKAEPWIEEWVGRGPNDQGIRGQVIRALDERKAMSITGKVVAGFVAFCGLLVGMAAAIVALFSHKGGV